MLLLAKGKPMFSDGRTISDEFMLAVEPSLSHLFSSWASAGRCD